MSKNQRWNLLYNQKNLFKMFVFWLQLTENKRWISTNSMFHHSNVKYIFSPCFYTQTHTHWERRVIIWFKLSLLKPKIHQIMLCITSLDTLRLCASLCEKQKHKNYMNNTLKLDCIVKKLWIILTHTVHCTWNSRKGKKEKDERQHPWIRWTLNDFFVLCVCVFVLWWCAAAAGKGA